MLLILMFSSTTAFEKGLGGCEVGSYNELIEKAQNQTCDGMPCSSLSDKICHYLQESCDRKYMTVMYLETYWCAHATSNWIADLFPVFLIFFGLFLVKVSWSTVDVFLDYSLYNTIAMWTSEKLACVSLLVIGSNSSVVSIGVASLLWQKGWTLWIGLNLSIVMIYNAGLSGLAFVRFAVQWEASLGKLSLFFLTVLCAFLPVMVLEDQLSLITAISILGLHTIFTVCVWFTAKNNAELGSWLLATVRQLNYQESVELRERNSEKKILFSKRSRRVLGSRATILNPFLSQSNVHDERNPFNDWSGTNPFVDQKENNALTNPLLDQSDNKQFNDESEIQLEGGRHNGSLSSSLETNFIVDDDSSPLLKGIFNPELRCWTRLLLLLELPLTLLRFLLIADTAVFFFWDGRQRMRTTCSIILGGLWFFWFVHKEQNGYGNWDFQQRHEVGIIILLAITGAIGLAFYFTTGSNKPPKKAVYLLIQILAIAVSCTFVYELANQLVNICFFFTLSFQYVGLFWLGFGILGPILCLHDIIDFISSAKEDSNDVVELDHTSPLMNLFIGLWLPCLCHHLKCENCINVKHVGLIEEICISLAVSALVQLIVLEFNLNIGVWRPRVGILLLTLCGISFVSCWIGNFLV